MKTTKLLSMLLCVLMLASVLIACKKDEVPAEDTTAAPETTVSTDAGSEETTWETDENGFVKDTITEDMVYGGKEVSVLARSEARNYCIPDKNNDKDVIQEAVYLHILEVEARLDIDLVPTYVNAENVNKADFFAKARSGEDSFDLIETYSLWPITLAQEGLLYNLNKLQYPKVEMPWYPDSITNSYEQYGSLYFITNNANVTNLRCTEVILVNEKLLENEGQKSPVQMTLDGTWTIDEMITITMAFSQQSQDSPGSVYGLVVDDNGRMDGLYYGAGFKEIVNDANGVATIAIEDAGTRDRISTLVEKLVPVFKDSTVYISPTSDNSEWPWLNAGIVALWSGQLADLCSTSSEDYVAVPMPKYDTDQTYYQCVPNNGIDLWCVPVTSDDYELSGVVIEAVSSSEYRTVGNYFYEEYLKPRYSEGVDGFKVFDIIRQSIYTDLGRVGWEAGISIGNQCWRSCFWTDGDFVKHIDNVFESTYQNKIKGGKINLAEVLANYRKYRDR